MKKAIIIFLSLIVLNIIIIIFFIYTKPEKPIVKDFDIIQKEGIVRIVTNLDPIGYFVSGDTISGYNHDVLSAIQSYTNVRMEISVENSLDKSLDGLKNGKYDVVARNIPINSDLRNEYKFTEPIIFNKLVLVQRKAKFNDSIQPIRNHLDLGGKTVYLHKNSPSIFRLQNLSHEIGDTIFTIEDDLYEANQLAFMVATGEIDFTVCDQKTAKNLSLQIPELDINTDIGFTHLEAWAIRASSPSLLDSLNVWINRFKKTKEYGKLLKKYY